MPDTSVRLSTAAVKQCNSTRSGEATKKYRCTNVEFYMQSCVWVGRPTTGSCVPIGHVPTKSSRTVSKLDKCKTDEGKSTSHFRCGTAEYHSRACVWIARTANKRGYCKTTGVSGNSAGASGATDSSSGSTHNATKIAATLLAVLGVLVLSGTIAFRVRSRRKNQNAKAFEENNAAFDEPELMWNSDGYDALQVRHRSPPISSVLLRYLQFSSDISSSPAYFLCMSSLGSQECSSIQITYNVANVVQTDE